MSISQLHYDTFKKGSKTYFNSSRFFPPEVREDVFILYGFVRVADNLVDSVPQDSQGFYKFKALYEAALAGQNSGDPIIDSFVELSRKHKFDPAWAKAFLYSMELDLTKKTYDTMEELLVYIHGSAEVIGLFMCAIFGLGPEVRDSAIMMGRSMQLINFIRDVAEDTTLGRRYLPLSGTTLKDLSPESVRIQPQEFSRFLRSHAEVYQDWQAQAEKGYPLLPPALLAPVRTASDMYNWTAAQIMKDPLVVFKRKVKPPKLWIMTKFVINRLGSRFHHG